MTRPWEPDVNRVLAEQVPTYPNARLLDWWGESAMHGDWFAKDKTHLNAAGANSYALLVAAALGDVAKQPPPTTTVATTVATTPAQPRQRPPRPSPPPPRRPPHPEGDARRRARLRSPA